MTILPSYLKKLESDSIYIIREFAASSKKPVMLYSIGKDSSVLLQLAKKAFFPQPLPFPVLHIDTGWKFKEMIAYREEISKDPLLNLLVYKNDEGASKQVVPFGDTAHIYTRIMKTEALKQAMHKYEFDAALCGARRDEEKSRAKERVFSIRTANNWDPKNQRPEFWRNYNTYTQDNQSFRVFPLSDWTELDIWMYIYLEKIPVVSLYFSKMRACVETDAGLIMVDDERYPLKNRNEVMEKSIRFRTLGCYPLTCAVESEAYSLEEVISEIISSKYSERAGRLVDFEKNASMEDKKKEGYF